MPNQSAAAAPAARPAGLPVQIDALLYDPDGTASGATWQPAPGMVGQPVALTYGFLQTAPDYAAGRGITDVRPFSTVQMQATRDILRLWSDVANITFTEVAAGGDIAFATAATGPSGYAFAPGRDWSGAGDVYLNHTIHDNTTPIPGFIAYRRLIHEIGHALGLKHPGAYDVHEPPYLPASQDNFQYTVMSYTAHPATNYQPTTPQLLDIAAVQYLYGANMATRAGDDTYGFSATEEQMLTIWDGGGTDRLDLTNQTANLSVDLRDGHFSSIGVERNGTPASANVAIAYGVVIENAASGSGHDTVYGNAAANELRGLTGNDTLSGLEGDDVLYGNQGADWVLGESGADTLFGGQGTDALSGGSESDLIYGNLESDVAWGDDGADTLFGGQGDDTLDGGAGDDVVAGNLGDDRLAGGPGADRFLMGYATGHDIITDFDAASGDRIQLFPGHGWSVTATADGARIDMAPGTALTLSGVDAGQVAAWWFT